MRRSAELERLYREYGSQIEFLIVYIREADPNSLKEGNRTGVVGGPRTLEERAVLASACVARSELTLPVVIDAMDSRVANAYRAAPVRATITDRDGRVVYHGLRGPWGYDLSEVERVLRRLVRGSGYLPSSPFPVRGKTVGGLSGGISVEPDRAALGERVAVRLEFRSESEGPLLLAFDVARARGQLRFENELGQRLQLAGGDPAAKPPGGGEPNAEREAPGYLRPRILDPGASWSATLEGWLVPAPETKEAAPGWFDVALDFAVEENMLPPAWIEQSVARAWTGRLDSGRFRFDLALTRPVSCASCHGVENGHHPEPGWDCTLCHPSDAGQDPGPDLDLSSCSRCHRRGDDRGRRRILDEEGEFSGVSVHLPGGVDAERCHLCHAPDRHGEGAVRLVDPRSGGERPWIGSATEFCLACHDGAPPAEVRFPEPQGSGYDKSSFPASAVGRLGIGCDACHAAHGSAHRSLLRSDQLTSPHE